MKLLGLASLGVPGLKDLGVPGLEGLGVLGLLGLGVPGLAGLVDPEFVTLPLLNIKAVVSPPGTLRSGCDKRWAFGSTNGASKSIPLTTALL